MSATIIDLDEARNGLRPKEPAVAEAAVESNILRLLLELAADMGVMDQVLQNLEDMEARE